MSTPLPSYVLTGEVVGLSIVASVDTVNDLDQDPDVAYPVGSTFTFDASVPYLRFSNQTPKATVYLQSVRGVVGADGTLDTPDGDPLKLIANVGQQDDEAGQRSWYWRVTPAITGFGVLPTFKIDVPAGGTVSLTDQQPVPLSQTFHALKGDQGDPGTPGANLPPTGTPDGYIAASEAGAVLWEDPRALGLVGATVATDGTVGTATISEGSTSAVVYTKTKADTLLGLKANTSDLTAKLDASKVGAANGVAPLGADQKVPAANLPATTTVFGVQYADVFGADRTGVADSSAAIASAIASLPTVTINGVTWRTGKVVLGVGTYRFNSALANLGPLVVLEGQGVFITTLAFYTSTAGPCLQVKGANTGAFNTLTFGGGVRNLTIDGTNAAAGAIGLQLTDVEEVKVDVAVQHFNKAGSIGYQQHNTGRWEEKVTARVASLDNSTACLLDTGATSTSNEYNDWDFTIYANPNQDGVVLADNIYINGSTLRIRGNFTCADPAPATNAVLRIGNGCNIERATVDVSVECGSGTNGPARMVIGNSVVIKASGRLGWGRNSPFASAVLGTSLIWDFVGSVYGAPTLGALQVKPFVGKTTITIPVGANHATQTLVFPLPSNSAIPSPSFDAAPIVIASAHTNGLNVGVNTFSVTPTQVGIQVATTDKANVAAAVTVTVNYVAFGNW